MAGKLTGSAFNSKHPRAGGGRFGQVADKETTGGQHLKASGVGGSDTIQVLSSRVRKYQGHDTVESFVAAHPKGRAHALRLIAADHKKGLIGFAGGKGRKAPGSAAPSIKIAPELQDGSFRAKTEPVRDGIRDSDFVIALNGSKKYPTGITVGQFLDNHPGGRAKAASGLAGDFKAGRISFERYKEAGKSAPPKRVGDPKDLQPGDEALNFGADTSPAFRADVRKVWGSIPNKVKRTLSKAGVTVHAPRQLIDVAPQLADKAPRGWPAGSTWKDVDGAYMPGLHRVIVAQGALNSKTGKYRDRGRGGTVLSHEIGHAFDAARNHESSTAAFKSAYDRDVADYLRSGGSRDAEYSYFLQAGEAGRSEMFAESFSEIVNGPSLTRLGEDKLTLRFPRVAAHIKKVIGSA